MRFRPLRSFAVFTFLTIASISARGEDWVRFDPPAPDANSAIRALVAGNICLMQVTAATTANTITVVLDFAAGLCVPPGEPPEWMSARIGQLAPGTYRVVFEDRIAQQRHEQTLVVRGVGPFEARPFGASAAGGSVIRLVRGDIAWDLDDEYRVFVDGTEVPVRYSRADGLEFVAPPHRPGPVDVVVDHRLHPREIVQAAFSYFDPERPPDPWLFEPLLFPIASDAAGRNGSSWSVENVVSVDSYHRAEFWRPVCAGCSPAVTGDVPVTTRSADGLLLYVVRGSDDVAASSLLREGSRGGMPTGLPVARERDFTLGPIRFPIVPAERNSRVTLRIWTLSDERPYVTVAVPMRRSSQPGLWVATLDITAAVARPGTTLRIAVNKPTWAMVSVTNDETQQVTIIAP